QAALGLVELGLALGGRAAAAFALGALAGAAFLGLSFEGVVVAFFRLVVGVLGERVLAIDLADLGCLGSLSLGLPCRRAGHDVPRASCEEHGQACRVDDAPGLELRPDHVAGSQGADEDQHREDVVDADVAPGRYVREQHVARADREQHAERSCAARADHDTRWHCGFPFSQVVTKMGPSRWWPWRALLGCFLTILPSRRMCRSGRSRR